MKLDQKNEVLSKAIEKYRKGDFKKAKILFNEIIERSDKKNELKLLIDSYFYLANIFHVTGDLGKSIKAFNKVLELDPGHTDASISLSVLYNDIGHYEKAKRIFNQANERVKSRGAETQKVEDVHINKKFASKHYELAELYMTYGRYDEALFEYNKVTALDTENLDARIKVAKVYAKKNFLSKAVEELKRLKTEHPDYHPARVALGILYYGNGRTLEAQTEWERVIAVDPKNEDAAMYLNLSKAATETSLGSSI